MAPLELGWNTQTLPGHELITEIITFWVSIAKPSKRATVGDLVDALTTEGFINTAERLEREFGRKPEIRPEIVDGILFNVKDPASLFTGREEELKKVHAAVQRTPEGSVTVVYHTASVTGLGGIGKTELARKYAAGHVQDYDGNIIWISAESKEALKESFLELARDSRVGVPTKDRDVNDKSVHSIVKETYRFFADRTSLFIFDNADTKEDLKEVLPSSLPPTPGSNKPFVLITSRERDWQRGIDVLSIRELRLEDAIEFIKTGQGISDNSHNVKIQDLVNILQRFPLAIQQAIAYIENEKEEKVFAVGDYLQEYTNKTQQLLDYDEFQGLDNDYAKTTFTTWTITFDKIRNNKNGFGNLALKILNIIAYLAPENISRELFLSLAEVKESKRK